MRSSRNGEGNPAKRLMPAWEGAGAGFSRRRGFSTLPEHRRWRMARLKTAFSSLAACRAGDSTGQTNAVAAPQSATLISPLGPSEAAASSDPFVSGL